MIPVLHEYPTYANDFTKNGYHLIDVIECTVEEEINGVYQLHLVYPIDGRYATKLTTLNVIVVTPAFGQSPQPFDIFRVSTPKHNRIEVDARHVSYRLNKHVVKPFRSNINGSVPADIFSDIESYSAEAAYNFTYQSDITRGCWLTVSEPMSIRKALSLITVKEQDGTFYSPEFTWDNFNVIMSKQRGRNKGVSIKYGKNLTDYKQEQTIEEVATGVLPYWKGKDSNKNDVVVVGYLKHNSHGVNVPYQQTIAVDFTSEFDEKPSAASLGYKAEDYLNQANISAPKVSLDVSFVILSKTLEYKKYAALYEVNLGDTITIEYEKLGVSAQARVTRTVYDVLKDRYKEISIGDAKIHGKSAEGAVKPVKQEVAQLSNAVNSLQTITNGSGILGTNTNVQNSTLKRCTFLKWGNLVFVNLMLLTTAANGLLAKDVTLYTAPDGFKPPSNVMLSGTCTTGGSANATLFSIYTNGQIHQRNFDNCTAVQLSAIYSV